ncbi:pseudouridine synthase [Pelagophyceae sp. CCMP2097]|nr:pseudouridine synthase [Pelagophyceae sp. CCMP2097]|mmetsp:Transcript_2190/g.7921  ORF Transcript_2190/g.7921 Transcript_2190/m.7921 type:complete len:580 (-) Transcript_2190:76-1815(-)
MMCDALCGAPTVGWVDTGHVVAGYEFFIVCDALPYVTSELPGIGGSLKQIPRHFVVTEVLGTAPDGLDDRGGCHYWLQLRRTGAATRDVQAWLAALFGFADVKEVGVSGLKDKRAVATQWFSVPSFSATLERHMTMEDVRSLLAKEPRLEVLAVQKSTTKLRRNRHEGNRFDVVVSDLAVSQDVALARARAVAVRLQELGWPNFYGPQRFSSGAATALRGGRLLKKIEDSTKKADRKKLIRRVLYNSMDEFAVNAFVSMLFNVWVARRIRRGGFARFVDGDVLLAVEAVDPAAFESAIVEPPVDPAGVDLATVDASAVKGKPWLPEGRSRFKPKEGHSERLIALDEVLDGGDGQHAAAEAAFRRGEGTYAGPLYGKWMARPNDATAAAALDDSVTHSAGIKQQTYEAAGIRGYRRAARLRLVPAAEAGAAEAGAVGGGHCPSFAASNFSVKKHQDGLLFSFALPSGAFATSLLREFLKTNIDVKHALRPGDDAAAAAAAVPDYHASELPKWEFPAQKWERAAGRRLERFLLTDARLIPFPARDEALEIDWTARKDFGIVRHQSRLRYLRDVVNFSKETR